jgi:hypothetical protein
LSQNFIKDRNYQDILFANIGEALRNDFDALLSSFSCDTAPSSPIVGQVWFDTINNRLMQFNGSIWTDITNNTAIYKDIQNAKGTKGSLWERLEVSLNEDGTLKSGAAENLTEWIDSGITPNYVASNEFFVSGDQRDIFVVNRSVKFTLDASLVYSHILSVSYDTNNNETSVILREGILDSTVQKVEHGVVDPSEKGSLAFITALMVHYDNSNTPITSNTLQGTIEEMINGFVAQGDIDLNGNSLNNVTNINGTPVSELGGGGSLSVSDQIVFNEGNIEIYDTNGNLRVRMGDLA